METLLIDPELSKYDKYILNMIINAFDAGKDFNIYELIEGAVTYKCILASQNGVVMDTFYAVKEYLVAVGFIIEKQEMTAYALTGKGIQLKHSGSIEKYEQQEQRKTKPSIFHKLLFGSRHEESKFAW